MEVNLKEEQDKLVVNVSIPDRRRASDPHRVVRTKEVLDVVKQKGYNVSEYRVESEAVCSTEGKNPTLSSTWVLRKVKNEKPVKSTKQRTRTNRSTRATKQNKLLRDEDLGRVQSQTQTNLSGQDKKVSRQ